MKGRSGEIERSQLVIRNLDACREDIALFDGGHRQAFFGRGMRDELKHDLKRGERFGTPVEGKEGEEPIFDRVPYTGGRRIMSDRHRQMLFIGKILQ
jgi:hypothetical protein